MLQTHLSRQRRPKIAGQILPMSTKMVAIMTLSTTLGTTTTPWMVMTTTMSTNMILSTLLMLTKKLITNVTIAMAPATATAKTKAFRRAGGTARHTVMSAAVASPHFAHVRLIVILLRWSRSSGTAAALSCPITGRLMAEPVCLSDGYTYERLAIEAWLRRGIRRSPKVHDGPLSYCVRMRAEC